MVSCLSRLAVSMTSLCLTDSFWHSCALGWVLLTEVEGYCPVPAVAGAGSSETGDDDVWPTYKDAFPPLPEKATLLEGVQEPGSAWTKIRPLKSSVITQASFYMLSE